MFNNANVIFRTKFVDGVSTVSRTIGSGANSRPRGALTNGGNRAAGNETAKRRRGRNNGKENSQSVEA